MKPKSSKFLAEDVTSYLEYLKFWSFNGFQHFLGSAIVSHMAEAIKAGTGKIVPALERRTGRQASISEYMGGVSSRQLQKFLSLIPGDVAEKREFWEGFEIWSRYSALWDDHEPDWFEKDDWREEMGLDRLNPVRLIGPYGKLLVFRRMVRNKVSESGIEGYRFATLEELNSIGTEVVMNMPDRRQVQSRKDGKWMRFGWDTDSTLYMVPSGDLFADAEVYLALVET